MNLQSPLCCASFCLTIMVAAVAVKLAPPPVLGHTACGGPSPLSQLVLIQAGRALQGETYRFAKCNPPLPLSEMWRVGLPLPAQYLDVIHPEIYWEDFQVILSCSLSPPQMCLPCVYADSLIILLNLSFPGLPLMSALIESLQPVLQLSQQRLALSLCIS